MTNDTTARCSMRRGYFPSAYYRKYSRKVGSGPIMFLAYLWTKDGDRNEMGYFPFDLRDAEEEIGLSEEITLQHITTLEKHGLVSYDHEEGLILLHGYMRGESRIAFSGASPNKNLKGCLKRLWTLPESPLLALFLKEASRFTPDLARAILQPHIIIPREYRQYAEDILALLQPRTPVEHQQNTCKTPVALSSEVMSIEEDLKFSTCGGASSDLSTDLSTTRTSQPSKNVVPLPSIHDGEDPDFDEMLCIFHEKYQAYMTEPHPMLFGDGWVRAHDQYKRVIEETGHLPASEWGEVMERYFQTKFKGRTDKRIWHFLSDGIALRLMAKEGYCGAVLAQMEEAK